MSVHDRLKEERARLGISQQEVADICEVHLKTAQRWEQSVPIPSDQLAALAPHGFDTQYIVSGIRAAPTPGAATESQSSAALSADEWKLIKRFRALGDIQRTQALAMIEVLAVGGSVGGGVQYVTATAPGSNAAGRDVTTGATKPRKGR